MSEDDVVGVRDYEGAAAGWGALKAVADAVRGQMAIAKETRGLLSMNQPHGFDCPGCAWPDPKHTSSFEFCENGAKAVTWEATAKRTPPEFFAEHTVGELLNWSDFDLENEGRLTHPMVYDPATDRYLPIPWDQALARSAPRSVSCRIPIWRSFTRLAGRPMRRRFSTSCLRGNMEPTTFPIARTCVTRPQALACQSRSVSARGR